MIRENGYYWVKFNPNHNFQIAEYIDGVYYMIGTKIKFYESSYCEILPLIID